MKIKQKVKILLFGLIAITGMVAAVLPIDALASNHTNNGCETDTAIIKCDNVDTTKDGIENTGAWSLLLTAINILTAGVGVVALGGIVYGAILYISAGGAAEQVKKAMGIFTNVVIGVIAFAGMFALLNFLVPGGLFNTPTDPPASPADCEGRILGVPPWFRGLAVIDGDGNCGIAAPSDAAGGLQGFIWKIALNIVEMGMVIAAYVAFLIILYSGFLFLTNGSNPSVVEKARTGIINAVIGLAIALAAIAIVNVIFRITG
jgi:hypothetical protein